VSDWSLRQPHNSQFDYNRFISDNNIVSRIQSGDIDEVWIYADPMAGMWESTMAGAGAYWVNSPPVSGVTSSEAFIIMGWNYERSDALALHSYGHRVESIMTHIYGSWPRDRSNNWGKFTLLDRDGPRLGGVGNIHFPVNGLVDYDYENSRYVESNADDWFNYPSFTGAKRLVNVSDWSPTPDLSVPDAIQRDYLNWWFRHIPHYPGRGPDRFLNDWWHYIIKMDQYKFGDQLLRNPSFEADANRDNRPDNWTSSSKFTRSTAVTPHQGVYVGRFNATDNSGVTITQTVANLAAGATYSFSGWVNIPAQRDNTFTFRLQIRWRNASGATISNATIKTYAAQTGGWVQATKAAAAPAGTTNAQIRVIASSLNGALYVDEFPSLSTSPETPPAVAITES